MKLLLLVIFLPSAFGSDGLPPIPPPTTTSISTWYTSDDGGGASDIDFSSSSSSDEADDQYYQRPASSQPNTNKPMKTLEKLQQMLDETDYMMQRKPLWTSSDRSKYKRQQRKYQREQQRQDNDVSDDDRMGYTLPDLPIYNSDAEDDEGDETPQYPHNNNHSSGVGTTAAYPGSPPTNNGRTAQTPRRPDTPFQTPNARINSEYARYPPNAYGYGPPQANSDSSYHQHQYPQTPGRFFDDRTPKYGPIRPPPIQQSLPRYQPPQPQHPDQHYYPQTTTSNDSSSQGMPLHQSMTSSKQPVQENHSRQQQPVQASELRQQQPVPNHYQQQQSTQPNAPQYFEATSEKQQAGFNGGSYGYHQPQVPQHPPPPNQQYPFNHQTPKRVYNNPEPEIPRSFPDIRQQYNDHYWQERYRQQASNRVPRTPGKPKQNKPFAVDPLPGLGEPLHLAPMPMMGEEYRDVLSSESLYDRTTTTTLPMSKTETLVEAGTRLNLLSLMKWGYLSVVASLLAYAAVSPRDLPLTEYNLQFYENLRLLSLMVIAPAVYIASTFDVKESDLNSFTHTFFITFSFGYLLTFAVEIFAITGLRLALFCFLEREVFTLTPKIALPILPWVLKEQNYRPKRITLLSVDYLTSCVLCPIIEESIKLALLISTSKLPINFRWKTKPSSRRKRKTKKVAEAITRRQGEKDCLSANRYVSQMLAVSLALKLCDGGRRVLLYTKASNANKSFYAFLRGGFPIHELCGTMTALALAKRDLLGFHIPLWKLLAPAVVVHGMANFRGKKPIFKWNSATPWSEMQLSPLHKPDASTLPQLLKKGYAKLMWVIILSRVLGYCIKNYYMVNRQAVKRTTKYAQNPAAFSAELATAELLKNQKQK